MFLCSLIEELCTKEENDKQAVTLILDISVENEKLITSDFKYTYNSLCKKVVRSKT